MYVEILLIVVKYYSTPSLPPPVKSEGKYNLSGNTCALQQVGLKCILFGKETEGNEKENMF